MRRLPTALSVAFLAVACAQDADHRFVPATVTTEVRSSMDALARQVSDSGLMGWIPWLSLDSLNWIIDGAHVPRGDSIVPMFRDAAGQFSSVQLAWVDVRVTPMTPSHAVVFATTRETLVTTQGDSLKIDARLLLVWRKGPEGWRILAGHTSHPPKP